MLRVAAFAKPQARRCHLRTVYCIFLLALFAAPPTRETARSTSCSSSATTSTPSDRRLRQHRRQNAEHRQARRPGREVRPRLLPVAAVRARRELLPLRPPARRALPDAGEFLRNRKSRASRSCPSISGSTATSPRRVGKIFHARTIFNGSRNWKTPPAGTSPKSAGRSIDPCGYGVSFATHPRVSPPTPRFTKITAEQRTSTPPAAPATTTGWNTRS